MKYPFSFWFYFSLSELQIKVAKSIRFTVKCLKKIDEFLTYHSLINTMVAKLVLDKKGINAMLSPMWKSISDGKQ